MLDGAIVHYCNYQERCHAEVRNKLYSLGFTTGEVERQLSELIETGLLNEERFARAFAGGKFRMKQWGRIKIRQELKLRKISDYCIRKGLEEIDAADYERTFSKLAARKADETKSDRSLLSRKAKVTRYLQQKGFENDMISDFVRELMQKTNKAR